MYLVNIFEAFTELMQKSCETVTSPFTFCYAYLGKVACVNTGSVMGLAHSHFAICLRMLFQFKCWLLKMTPFH